MIGARLLQQGRGVSEIARLLGVAPAAVWCWKRALEAGGVGLSRVRFLAWHCLGRGERLGLRDEAADGACRDPVALHVDAHEGMPVQPHDLAVQPAGVKASIAEHQHLGGTQPSSCPKRFSQTHFQLPFSLAGRMAQATGMAQPR